MSDVLVLSIGYLASALVFITFYMKTMVPLRCVAIASNVAFLTYGAWLGLWPIAILHGLMLPLNSMRLMQIRRMLTEVRTARTSDLDLGAIVRSFEAVRYPRGTVLFRKGDPGDFAYYVAKGEITFPEIEARCGIGQLFGEIAIFSPEHARMASAICASDVELYRIDEHALVTAFHQSAPFAFSLLRLITTRLLDDLARRADDYEHRSPAPRLSAAD